MTTSPPTTTSFAEASATDPRPSRRGDADLSLPRLYLMRFGYAFMGLGLVVIKWPLFVNPPESWPLAQSVVDSILAAMALLALFGLRYPIRMLPVLLLESTWKLLWLGAVALPAARAGDMNAAMSEVVFTCSLVVLVLVAVPWRWVWTQYTSTPGDRWR